MLRLALSFCLVLLAAPVAALDPASGAASADAAEAREWRHACEHYANRARFRSRERNVDFVTVLAEGCAEALADAGDASAEPIRAAAARDFLRRIAAGRSAVNAINSARLTAAGTRRDWSFSRRVRNLSAELHLVSETGEYLILRAEGVFGALDSWAAAGRGFALLAALP